MPPILNAGFMPGPVGPVGPVGPIGPAGPAGPVNMVTVQNTATTAISNLGPTILLTLPALGTPPTGAVLVTATINYENTGGASRDVTVEFFRDGVEVSATDRYNTRLEAADDGFTVTYHWVDSAPGAAPVYTIRAVATNTGVNRVTNSRGTAISA